MYTPLNTSFVFSTSGTRELFESAHRGLIFGTFYRSIIDASYLQPANEWDSSWLDQELRLDWGVDGSADLGLALMANVVVSDGEGGGQLPVARMGYQRSSEGADTYTPHRVIGPLARGPTIE